MTGPDHSAALDHAISSAITHHAADAIRFTSCGVLHTADAWLGDAHFVATAQTSEWAFGLAMVGLRAAIGGAA